MRSNKGKRDTRNHIFKLLTCTIQENKSTTENKKVHNNFNRPDERKMVETNTICRKKEITVINKTADNIAPLQTIVLNTYVTKKTPTKNKLKHT